MEPPWRVYFMQKLIAKPVLPVQPIPQICSVLQLIPYDGKVYRLLRPDENPAIGISPRDSYSMVSAAYHVAWGSILSERKNSKYISTSMNKQDILSMAEGNNYTNGDIISIDVGNAPVSEILHVWDANVRAHLNFEQGVLDKKTIDLFTRYATKQNEVLLVGDLPAQYCEIILPKNKWKTCPILLG
ncbi:unnamed protein product [Mytilus coruscus]|uniref:Uncharacterized protein n=1 Tax=Mytilus coruscus TaxID=42192 RepID=A0A6J8EPM4_MYTCO|nr:unnamed protein product [Mytilus coruscus]